MRNVRIFFNLLMPFIFMIILPYRIWENVHGPDTDQGKVFVQSILLLFAIGIFSYRLYNLIKASE
jgi:hypothetical protein